MDRRPILLLLPNCNILSVNQTFYISHSHYSYQLPVATVLCSTFIMKTCVEFPRSIEKNRATIEFNTPSTASESTENEVSMPETSALCVYYSTICNSHKIKSTKMSIYRRIHKEMITPTTGGILFILINCELMQLGYNVSGPGTYYVRCSKSNTGEYATCNFTPFLLSNHMRVFG